MRLQTYWGLGSTPTVADLDGNGRLNVIVGSQWTTDYVNYNGSLYVWQLPPAAIAGNAPWPMFRQGPLRTGRYTPRRNASTAFHTLTPCRVFDTRVATGPTAGAPALAANSRRGFALTGKCGIPMDATALSINVTVTGASAAGEVKITPGTQMTTNSSRISFGAGRTRASMSVMRLWAASRPKPQWVVILQGGMEIGLQDGSSRVFGPGEHFFSTDTLPEGATFDAKVHGHWSRQIGSQPLITLFLKT